MSIYTYESALAEIIRLKSKTPYYVNLIRKIEYKSLLEWINIQIPDGKYTIGAKIFLLLNSDLELICPYGKEKKYRADLSKFVCIKSCQCTKDNRSKTNVDVYGSSCPLKSIEVQEKRKNTCIELYGVDHPSKSEEIKNKKKQTCIKNFGYDNNLKSPKCREKRKKTMLEKYGYENPGNCPEIIEKQQTTCMERYGVNTPFDSKEIQEKSKNTREKNYKLNSVIKKSNEKLKNISIYGKEDPTSKEKAIKYKKN